jgi:NitT/TauT family transport system permease protein
VKGWRGVIVPVVLLALAEIVFRVRGGQSDSLAPPSRGIAALLSILWDGSLVVGSAQTLGTLLAGLALGSLAGLAAGIALGSSELLGRMTFLTIEMLRPIPSVALLPLSLLIFGFGYRMEIAVIAFATFWPTLILMRWTGAPGDRQKVDGGSPSR